MNNYEDYSYLAITLQFSSSVSGVFLLISSPSPALFTVS